MRREDLRPATYNPRSISEDAASGLGFSLSEFGDISGITWNEETGNLVSGHQRVKYLNSKGASFDQVKAEFLMGENVFRVRVVRWGEDKEKAANLAANNPHSHGVFDESCSGILDDVREAFGEEFFSSSLFDKMSNDIESLGKPAAVEEDEVPVVDGSAVTKRGDKWSLGPHRLYCVDSREEMHAKSASAMVTDPPYGFSYTGKTIDALKIKNDDLPEVEMAAMMKSVFDTCLSACAEGAYWFATIPSGPLQTVFLDDWKSRGILRQVMVWLKDSMVLSHSEYHYRHELIMFGWVPGASRRKNPDRTRTSVWEFDRPKSSESHPTTKPVGLFAKMITDSTDKGGLVIDPFLGSGTTLIAAEQTGRVCYGNEVDESYCDVIVDRWESLTGGNATRV